MVNHKLPAVNRCTSLLSNLEITSTNKLVTFEQIEEFEKQHAEAPHLRTLQKAVAKDVTVRVHGEKEYEMALKASEILFGKNPTEALKTVDERTFLSVFDGVPKANISKSKMQESENVMDLLSAATDGIIFSSKGEARRMIQGGGVSINKSKISDPGAESNFDLIQDKYLLVQKGKKNYFLIEVEA